MGLKEFVAAFFLGVCVSVVKSILDVWDQVNSVHKADQSYQIRCKDPSFRDDFVRECGKIAMSPPKLWSSLLWDTASPNIGWCGGFSCDLLKSPNALIAATLVYLLFNSPYLLDKAKVMSRKATTQDVN
jgi:hypothetical protein